MIIITAGGRRTAVVLAKVKRKRREETDVETGVELGVLVWKVQIREPANPFIPPVPRNQEDRDRKKEEKMDKRRMGCLSTPWLQRLQATN